MRTTFVCLSLCALLVVTTTFPGADAKKDVVLDSKYLRDHAETRGFMLGRPVKAKPTPDGKAVLFLRSEPRDPKLSLFEYDVASGKTKELLTPAAVLKGAEEKLTPEEKARRERQRVSAGGFTDYQLSEDGKQILLGLSGKLYVYDRAAAAVRELQTGKGTLLDPKFSPDGKQVGYVLDYDVYTYDLEKNKETRVTTGGTEKKTHGLAEFVAQEEMGRFSGYWWSPDSKSIVYEEADAEGVEVWYVADPVKPDQPPHAQYYPRPGKKNVSVRAGIIPATGGETVWIDWDRDEYPYLVQVHWDEFGPLTVTVMTRLQQELVLKKVNPKTGTTVALATERDGAFLNVHQEVPFMRGDGDYDWVVQAKQGPELWPMSYERGRKYNIEFVRARDGYRGLIEGPDRKGSYYLLCGDDPTTTQLWHFLGFNFPHPLNSKLLDGVSAATFAKKGKVLVAARLSKDSMPRTTVHDIEAKELGELPFVAEDPGFKPNVEIQKIGDGDGFYSAVVRPHNFDPKKRYPVLVYVYGGPHHLQVQQSMGLWLLPQWLADQGFIVVSLDNRGTPGRGRDWERAVYRKFGTVPLDDQVAGLQALGKKYPEMDLDRVGIYGWSFGGYMSALAVLKRPDIFKAAVAGAPVTDWEDYDTFYTERYMGLPQDNPEAYKEASLLTYAKDLKRPLLLVHGTADDNVYFRHSLKLANALFREGKEFEILPLTGLTHMVPDPVVTQRLYERFAAHFQKHLGKPEDR
jgi:dipeptidyl-peptidase 4